MKVAVLGASGRAGSAIVSELASRGHAVIGVARNPERITSSPQVTAVKGDVKDAGALTDAIKGVDAVVSAIHFVDVDADSILNLVKDAGIKRYIAVGGAGSLLTPDGKALIESPDFPDAYRPEAEKGSAFLSRLKQEQDLDWTFLSPSALFDDNTRTGSFRIGKDHLLTDGKGNSAISFPDYAIALVDELEQPAHIRQRFTVGY